MKKIYIALILMILSFSGIAQEKGAYLTFSGGIGLNGMKYELQGLSSDGKNLSTLGGSGSIGFSYFFTPHWGISTGVGVSYYRTKGKYNDSFKRDDYYSLGTYVDDDEMMQGKDKEFELRVRVANWEELQTGYFFEIPLMLMYQNNFGRSNHGFYIGAGAKVQIPVSTKYKVQDSRYENDFRLNISGNYVDPQMPEMGFHGDDVNMVAHGFGSVNNPHERYNWEGDFSIKPSFAVAGELGFVFALDRRWDLMVGGYIDYGLNSIKKGDSNPLFEGPEGQYHPAANENIGEGIKYNGMLNSDRTGDVNLLSYGAKVTLRLKLGKPRDMNKGDKEEQVIDLTGIEESLDRITSALEKERRVDTIIIERERRTDTVIIEKEVPVQAPQRDEDGLYPDERDLLKERVFFDLNSSYLHAASKIVLDRKVALLKRHPEIRIRLLGNTCDRGNEKINIPLGLRRANEVKNYMISRGIRADRIITATQASNDPILPNVSEENRAINRRVDFEVDTQRE